MGETCQPLRARISQYKSDVKNLSSHTALSSHTLETGHIFNFDDVAVIGREEKEKKENIGGCEYFKIS